MTSSSKTIVSDGEFSTRILELRKKIHDSNYLDSAIQRIALVLSKKLVEDDDQRIRRGEYESKR